MTNQYPDVVFSGQTGYSVMVYSEPLFASSGSNFLCVVRAGQPSSTCEPNGGMRIKLSRPAEQVSLTVLGANGSNVGRYELYSGSTLRACRAARDQRVAVRADGAQPRGVGPDRAPSSCCDIDDLYGLAWDDLAFSLR